MREGFEGRTARTFNLCSAGLGGQEDRGWGQGLRGLGLRGLGH